MCTHDPNGLNQTRATNNEPLRAAVTVVNDEPLKTTVVRDNEPSAFESRSLKLGWWGFGVAFLSLVAACVAGFLVYQQFDQMYAQTTLQEISARQARRDSAEASANTSKQLQLAQRQATIAQQQADAATVAVQQASKEATENAARFERQLKILGDQVDASRKSASAIQQQTLVSERPWVTVDVSLKDDLTFTTDGQATVVLKLQLRNPGRSIAKRNLVVAKLMAALPGPPVTLNAKQIQKSICDGTQAGGKGEFLGQFDVFPDSNPITRNVSVSVAKSDIDSISQVAMQGNQRWVGLSLVGCVIYSSSFESEPHITYFAYRLEHLRPPPYIVLAPGQLEFADFEVGDQVPQKEITMLQELFGLNEAD